MGNCKLEEKFKQITEVESDFQLSQAFDEMCPMYMSYGMSYDEYWYGEPSRCKYYREAYKLKKEALDEQLWLQGLYVYHAIAAITPVMNPFAKKGTKPLPYLKSPMTQTTEYKEINGENEISEEEKQRRIENERLIAQVHFDNWARMMNRKFANTDNEKSGKEIK